MAMIDFRAVPDGTQFGTDICIIGSGPAGLAIALEFARTSVRVCLVESGGLEREASIESLNEIENVGMRRAPTELTRCRGFGGTSALWSGRCGVFDAIDYQQRSWVPHSGWPISASDLKPYYDRAGRLLGLGPALYDENDGNILRFGDADEQWNADIFRPIFWQFSQHDTASGEPVRHFAERDVGEAEQLGMLQHSGAPKARHLGEAASGILPSAENIQVLLYANATSVETNDTGTEVRSVQISTLDNKKGIINARRVVIACGGIDNARLLLCSRSNDPRGLGNSRDLVGRFLSDHPFWPIATYRGPGDRRLRRKLGHFWLDRNGARHVYCAGIRLSPQIQQREQLLNSQIHIVELGRQLPSVSRLGSAVRRARAGSYDKEMLSDLGAALSRPIDLASGIYSRYIRRAPALAHPDQVTLGAVVEQVPDPESRVLLSDEKDALGMNRAKLDWRISDREFASAKRTAELLELELRRLGYDMPEFAPWLSGGSQAFLDQIHDMAHPTGTTRMSDSPSEGVVDSNCQIHGVSGLYIAGSSTFTTSGYMNPTLMIAALSIRLADHLKSNLKPQAVEAKIA